MFLREGLTARKPRDFERDATEAIFLELAISNKTWFFIFACRPPISNNKDIFFSELSSSLDRATATMKHDNLLVIVNLNIDTLNKKNNNGNYFSDICDFFSLKNLMTDTICVKPVNGPSIDVLLTNKY